MNRSTVPSWAVVVVLAIVALMMAITPFIGPATDVRHAQTLADVISYADRIGAIRIERGGSGKANHHFIATGNVEAIPPVPSESM